MEPYQIWILVAVLLIWPVVTILDIRYERAKITQYLRIGGARILRFRWKPFVGLMGADSKSKHYEVTFEEHTGRVVQAIFTYTSGVGVMRTSERILREPNQGRTRGG